MYENFYITKIFLSLRYILYNQIYKEILDVFIKSCQIRRQTLCPKSKISPENNIQLFFNECTLEENMMFKFIKLSFIKNSVYFLVIFYDYLNQEGHIQRYLIY